jgi:hypothetical protein
VWIDKPWIIGISPYYNDHVGLSEASDYALSQCISLPMKDNNIGLENQWERFGYAKADFQHNVPSG